MSWDSSSNKLNIDDTNLPFRMIHPQGDNGISFYKNRVFSAGRGRFHEIRLSKGIGGQGIQNFLRFPA